MIGLFTLLVAEGLVVLGVVLFVRPAAHSETDRLAERQAMRHARR